MLLERVAMMIDYVRGKCHDCVQKMVAERNQLKRCEYINGRLPTRKVIYMTKPDVLASMSGCEEPVNRRMHLSVAIGDQTHS